MALQTLALRNALFTIFLSAGLVACGGGGGSSSQDNSGGVTAPEKSPEELANARINAALSSGNVANLTKEDQTTLLKWALSTAEQQRYWQKNLLNSLYSSASGQVLQPYLQAPAKTSLNLFPTDLSTGIPFAMGDAVCGDAFSIQSGKGCGLGVMTKVGDGRVLAYGQEMFAPILNNNTNFTQFKEVMNNSLRWLITGDAHQEVKKTLNVMVKGTTAAPVKSYLEGQLATSVTFPSCNVLDPANTCWQDVDLIVLGQGIGSESFEKELIEKYLKAGKAIYFQGSSWQINDNTQKFFSAAGIQASYNWFRAESTLLMSNTATVDERWARINQVDDLIQTLKYFIDPASVTLGDVNSSNALVKSIQTYSSLLQSLNGKGVSAFSAENSNGLLKALVLIADTWRPEVNYTGLSTMSDSLTFMKTFASDAWLDYHRNTTTTSPNGAGDYMPATAQNMAVSSDYETIKVTIPQASGITAIGRASIPAKAMDIQIVDAQGANLSVQTSFLRTWGSPFSTDGYKRPLRPNSYSVKLNAEGSNAFISPFGGPLMLNYSGATAGTTITLKIKGGAKYAHYDFTQEITDTDIAEASASLKSKTFGWNTFKFVGGEIQQTTSYAISAMGARAPSEYVKRIKDVIFDSNHIANGYNNMALDSSTQQACNALGWDCTSSIHRAPNVQHFVGWIATCGYLCSGNPVDAYTGVDVGWGWVHELGHNTVQNVLTMTFPSTADSSKTIGCGTECDNNILAGLSMSRKYSLYGEDSNGDRFNQALLYSYIKENRSTGLSGEALRQDMETRLWQGNDNAKMSFHMQLAFLYTQLHQGKAKADLQGVFEFMRLLNTAQRLYNNIDLATASTADKNKLGLGAYTAKSLTRPDLIYILSSKIMGYDLKQVFALYGLPVSNLAKSSVALLNLSDAPLHFYAQAKDKANLLDQGTWVTIPTTGTAPAYPF